MARFIILRGPMGAGKSKVGKYLAKALDDSFLLDLDLNANCPIEGLNEALGHKNVVTELYHGNSHTTDPKWIKEVQERGYSILSVILKASLETHVRRLLERPDNRNRDYIEHHYNKFHFELKSIFKARAGIEEITIDTDKMEIEQIRDEILKHLNEVTT
jgi:shikimate kinase